CTREGTGYFDYW
nr:immunoglobulin heavy chain junction region [Mus musculus]NSM04029.1 immunoglobulin heavy chain junction region [Mus musculus]NSM04080.1 immunoglobulin heavy chain junction region [Mus musculus]NSM04218.1 immunoglobulin heavy chain junction region [Mus musculus]NSM04311.1 immunoglobulin heavy chain junction region [Mus musculus]